VKWLWELHNQRAGGIIGDEMGLGKTIQVIRKNCAENGPTIKLVGRAAEIIWQKCHAAGLKARAV
jgi:SNF2 family DNA or RNA helicase